ncbi:MAG: dihydropteroate synthase [Bacteroidaceae bacterium]|nr:dihydropteroate synthase [Bacteroidaceae bacterium]
MVVLNVHGHLLDLSKPQVMGILNLTPDSFYAASRVQTEEAIRKRVRQIADEGGTMMDVGAYSSRPGADDVSPKEEMERLRRGLKVVREEAPNMPLSVDTFRADVAKMAVEELGADIINDISGGELDPAMFTTVARLGVPYILMHMKGTPKTMQQAPRYDDLLKEVMLYFAKKVQQLRDLGQKDIILDPGYGFGKTLDQNYELLRHQEMLQVFELPLLVGVSRKSMIYHLLGTTPQEALNGTTVLNTIALTKGANILRVHDVKAALEVTQLISQLLPQDPQL